MKSIALGLLFAFSLGCSSTPKNLTIDPKIYGGDKSDIVSIDTSVKKITRQKKKTYFFKRSNLYVSNRFPGGKANLVKEISKNHIEVYTEMENFPINDSAWYAVKVWSKDKSIRELKITLRYPDGKEGFHGSHRYTPKVSKNGIDWAPLADGIVAVAKNKRSAEFSIMVSDKPQWISAQELITTKKIETWSQKLAKDHSTVSYSVVGKLKSGRTIHKLTISDENSKERPHIVIFGRQHPPEVTGSLALESFVEKILDDSPLSVSFRNRYNLTVYPLINPDGVDEGHWRHGLGGADLNRDWGLFNQEETTIVGRDIQSLNNVVFGVDFHSTFSDVIYITEPTHRDLRNDLPMFWVKAHAQNFPERNFIVRTVAKNVYHSTSLYWLYNKFGAQGFVYEVGDKTDRTSLVILAKSAAESFMTVMNK